MVVDGTENKNGTEMSDIEKGTNEKSGEETEPPATTYPEAYITVPEIVSLHPESRIDIDDIERSQGLTSEEATKRFGIYGKNMLTPPKKTPEWLLFLKQFSNVFMIMLIACAVLSLLSYILFGDRTNLYLALVLLIVVFLTGLVGYREESEAAKVIESFTKILPSQCKVIRDGKQDEIDAAMLVPGDLIVVQGGDKVPADIVLLKCRGLKTDCSMITGEAELVTCTDLPSAPTTGSFECLNLGFNGSLCFDGLAVGLVLLTGDKTAIGSFAMLVSQTKARESTLQKEIKSFVKLVGIIAFTMAAGAFTVSVITQGAKTADDIFKIFINGFLVVLVANIPQGLPSTVVSLLSLAARKMAKAAVLVKRIDCVETLGSTSIICSDKTGTLTKNEMTVTDIWYEQRMIKMYRNESKSLFSEEPQALIYRCAIVCNRADFASKEDWKKYTERVKEKQERQYSNVSRLAWGTSAKNSTQLLGMEEENAPKFKGNPSDAALLNYFNKSNAVATLRHEYPILFEVPFNSTNKWQLVIVKALPASQQATNNNDTECDYQVLMKGAPEVILTRCSTYAKRDLETTDHEVPVTQAFQDDFVKTYEGFASQGRRVLAFASKLFKAPANFEFEIDDDGKYNFPTTDLKFIGMTAIMDPPRDNVPDAIASCHAAGVKVFMVTGDHPLTGSSIAKQIGLLKSDNNIELLPGGVTKPSADESKWQECDGAIVHGARVDDLTDEQWSILLTRTGGVCFARTTPVHKRLIVEKCQTLVGGACVAVTGDGVNDAPALKQADIGIAMGLNGSAVAQDAADILLMDDNFASIVKGIEVGRIIFDNIKKTIAYIMAHIFPEVISALLALLIGLPAGLTALQVLTIDLGTEMLVAISLANEEAESDIMKRKPRDLTTDRLVSPALLFYSYVTAGLMISAGCMLSYTYTYWQNDLYLSDFYKYQLSESGDFFSLTASDPVFIQRTGKTYSPEEQQNIFSQGATAFYITLTCAQFCHIWSCKTRVNSLFTHGVSSNKLTFVGVGVGILIVIFFSYIPGVQTFVGSATVGWFPWVMALVTGLVTFIWNELVKLVVRRTPPGTSNCVTKVLAW